MKQFILPQFPVQAAIEELNHYMNRGDEREHMILVDKNGSIICHNVGDEEHVEYKDEKRFHRDAFSVHSHPGVATELSVPDLEFIEGMNIAGNMAVCHDGTISWTSGMIQLTPLQWAMRTNHEVEVALSKFPLKSLNHPNFKDKTEAEMVIHQSRFIIEVILKKKLLKDYHIKYGSQYSQVIGVPVGDSFNWINDHPPIIVPTEEEILIQMMKSFGLIHVQID